jgi:CheY-like chemotaxis protein
MQFDVIDTGIGMADEHMGKLFKPFSQGTSSTAAQYGGTGLGLVISQRLARLLGGDITVRSTFGEGSTFSLVVNIGQLHGRRMTKASAAMHDSVAAIPFIEDQYANELLGARVLLADDNPANLDLISKILHASGASVSTVNSGRKACHEAMEAFQAGRIFNVVLLDMQMPELDGAAATARLRQLGYPGPVIVLTSSVVAADHDRCLKAGCTEIARKPISRDKLVNVVAKHSGKRQGRRTADGTWFGNAVA